MVKKSTSAKGMPTDTKTNIIDFFNRVMVDGRYIKESLSDPKGVATKLGLSLSSKAISSIKKVADATQPLVKAGAFTPKAGGGQTRNALIVAIVIIVASKQEDPDVIDESGIAKE